MFIDSLDKYKIGSESDPVTMRGRAPEEEFKCLESLNGRLRNELQDTWNVLKEYKLTMKDN